MQKSSIICQAEREEIGHARGADLATHPAGLACTPAPGMAPPAPSRGAEHKHLPAVPYIPTGSLDNSHSSHASQGNSCQQAWPTHCINGKNKVWERLLSQLLVLSVCPCVGLFCLQTMQPLRRLTEVPTHVTWPKE